MKKLFLVGVLLIALAQLAHAQSIEISRQYPREIKLGEELQIEIALKNLDSFPKSAIVYERIDENSIPVEPKNAETVYIGFGETKETRFSWEINLGSLEEKKIIYRVRPLKIGAYNLYSTRAYSNGENYKSEANIISVKCIPNNACDEGENEAYCPEDCTKSEIECYTDNDCGQIGYCDDGTTFWDIKCSNSKCTKQTGEFCKSADAANANQKYDQLLLYAGIAALALVIAISILHFRKGRRKASNPQIKSYISANLKKGYTKQQIRNALIKNGYSEREIEEAFKAIK